MSDPIVRPPRNPVAGISRSANAALYDIFAQPFVDASKALRGGMTEQESQDFAFNSALGLSGPGGAALKPLLAIFAGVGAKTANKAALQQAVELTAMGVGPKKVFEKTGWFSGADGKWRFEIPDDRAVINPNIYGSGLPQIGKPARAAGEVWHKELYDAYPELRDAYVRLQKGEGTGRYFPPGGAGSSPVVQVEARTPNEARSIALHELQHSIQETEGFTGGGSPESVLRRAQQVIAERGGDPRMVDNAAAERAYRRLAGEVEARNVQTRMDMTPDQRRAAPPWATQDVPLDRQIVRQQSEVTGLQALMLGPNAKNADNAALAKAQELTAQGADRSDIWKQTGWYQDNGKWWFEAPDTGLTTRLGRGKGIGPDSPISHPLVAENYANTPSWLPPETMNVLSRFGPAEGAQGGILNPAPGGVSVRGLTNKTRTRMAAHELQHLVQDKEGIRARPLDRDRDGIRAYENQWMERQARNAEARLPMTEAERRAIAPWETMPPERGWRPSDVVQDHPFLSVTAAGMAPVGALLATNAAIPDEKVEEWKRIREERRNRPPPGPNEWPNDNSLPSFLRRIGVFGGEAPANQYAEGGTVVDGPEAWGAIPVDRPTASTRPPSSLSALEGASASVPHESASVPGYLDAMNIGVRQGATGNWWDEIGGVNKAGQVGGMDIPSLGPMVPTQAMLGLGRLGYEAIRGQPGEATSAYEAERDRIRQQTKDAQQNFPMTSLASNVTGAVALPVGRALQAVSLPLRALRSAIAGGVYGGVAGAGEGESGTDRLGRGLTGAGIGTAAGAVGVPVLEGAMAAGRGVRSAISNVPGASTARGFVNADREASRLVEERLKRDAAAGRSAMTPQEFAAAQAEGAPVALIDQGGDATRALSRWASDLSPEGLGVLKNLVEGRFGTQAGRFEQGLHNLIPTPGAAGVTRDALDRTAQSARSPFYQAAMRKGAAGIFDDELYALSQAPAMQQAVKEAIKQAENRAVSTRSGPMVSPDGTKPTLEFWDLVKKRLDQSINVAKREGRKEDVMVLNDIRKTMLDKLDSAVPEYSTARGVAAELFKASNALEAGEKFATSTMKNSEFKKILGKMHAEEKALFAEGYVSRYIERLNEVRDRNNLVTRIRQSPADKERFEMVLGPQAARQFDVLLAREAAMDLARSAVTGNSQTARFLAEAGIMSTAHASMTGFSDPTAILTGMLTYGMRKGQAKANQNIARRVAELLASPNPPSVQRGVTMVSNNPRLRESLARAEEAMARIGAQQSPKTGVLESIQGPMHAPAENEQ